MRKLLHTIKRVLNKTFGMTSNVWFWKCRHIFDKSWTEKYISPESLNHPHRKILVDKISAYAPFKTVLEIGCASGPNLCLLAGKFPYANLAGVDISRRALETGNKRLKLQGIENVNLSQGNVLNLKNIKDKSFDITFTDAVLIYVDGKNIENVIKEFLRVTEKAVILTEWHAPSLQSMYDGNWIHNYQNLFKKLAPNAQLKFTKITRDVWTGGWEKYGYIIEVQLK